MTEVTAWLQREQDQLRRENAWLDDLSPLMRLIDNPVYYMLGLALMYPTAFMLGVMIGWLV